MTFEDGNPHATVAGEQAKAGVSHYIQGNDPTQWVENVPHYGAVRYTNMWPGIDVLFYGIEGNHVEFDFVVAPGADPDSISLALSGTDDIEIAEGRLHLTTGDQTVVWPAPVTFQGDRNAPTVIPSRYHVDAHTVTFQVDTYDPEKPLIIDPVILASSTFLGGSSSDNANDVAVDADGNVYVAGQTSSSNFPMEGAIRSYWGPSDPFITKFSPSWEIIYSTYLGGSSGDQANGIAVDGHGNTYVTGTTSSSNFPTKNPIQSEPGGDTGSDAFVSKISPSGTPLLYSTYLGGSSSEKGHAIAIDPSGEAHISGETRSSDFPTKNAKQSSSGGSRDAFVTKVAANGQSWVYSTYLGGSSSDYGYDIAADDDGYSYVTGKTRSTNFPTSNAIQSSNQGSNDAFLTKFSPTGSSHVFSTYLGGSGTDWFRSLARDTSGNILLAGTTTSLDFPLKNAQQGTYRGNGDAIVAKIDSTGSNLLYSTYLGGRFDDLAEAIAVDDKGQAVVTGPTYSDDFPTVIPYQSNNAGGSNDVFVTQFTSDGTAHVYSTYLGGSGTDEAEGVTITSDGRAIVVGVTSSANFPTEDPYDGSLSGNEDAFITVMNPAPGTPDLTDVKPGLGQLELTWIQPDDEGGSPIAGYNVYRGTSPGNLDFHDTAPAGTSYLDVGLGNGVTYYYAVSAYNDDFEGLQSSVLSATTFDTPSAPRNLEVTAGPNPAQITVTWVEPADDGQQAVTSYHVYRAQGSGPLAFHEEVTTGTSLSDTGLLEGTHYRYRVHAINAVGEGDTTPVLGATTFAVPAAPSNLNAVRGSAPGEIDLSWTGPADTGGTPVTNYRIYAGTAPGALSFLTDIGPETAWTHTDLPLGATRYYQVAAINIVGEGPPGNEDSASAPDVPTEPRSLSSTRGPGVGQIKIDWQDPASDGGLAISNHDVWVAHSLEDPFILLATVGNVNTFTQSGLPDGAIRCYKVSATNAAGTGPLSEAICGQAPDVPTAPQDVRATTGDTGQVLVEWEIPADDNGMEVSAYTVYRTTVSGGETVQIDVAASSTSLMDGDRIPGVRYYYTVSATNGVGEGPTGEWDSARAGTYDDIDRDGDFGPDLVEDRVCSTPGLQVIWEATPGITGHPLLGHCADSDLQTLSGLDTDGDLMPDALEPTACLFDSSTTTDDGVCVDGDWGPPPGDVTAIP